MLNWNTTVTLDSKVAPEVRLTFRTFSAVLRAQLEIGLAEYRACIAERVTQIQQQIESLPDGADKQRQAEVMAAGFNVWLESQRNAVEKVPTLRTYLFSVEGVEIDGKTPTVPEFIDRAPAELIDEAFAFIIANGGLPEGVAKNSQSHTTLPAPVDGATTDTSAGTAVEGD
jgi:hypothetical protein